MKIIHNHNKVDRKEGLRSLFKVFKSGFVVVQIVPLIQQWGFFVTYK